MLTYNILILKPVLVINCNCVFDLKFHALIYKLLMGLFSHLIIFALFLHPIKFVLEPILLVNCIF